MEVSKITMFIEKLMVVKVRMDRSEWLQWLKRLYEGSTLNFDYANARHCFPVMIHTLCITFKWFESAL